MKQLIKTYTADMLIYAIHIQFNDCTFFNDISEKYFEYPCGQVYLAQEFDVIKHEDLSINRCPAASDCHETSPLLFTNWKQGNISPCNKKDYSSAHLILEGKIKLVNDA